MISIGQIIIAGALTAVAVGVTAYLVKWTWPWTLAAALGSLILIVGWRLIANGLQLNSDFLPAVSFGDVVCLIAGSIAPAAVTVSGRAGAGRSWLPAIVGGLAAFVINVVVL